MSQDPNCVLTKVVKGQRLWIGKDREGGWCEVDTYDRAWVFVSSSLAHTVLTQLADRELIIIPIN